MLNREMVDKITHIASQFPAIERIYVFGSQAGPGLMKKSDIDLAIDATYLSEADRYRFAERVQTELGRLLPVDVSVPEDADFKRRIRNEGQLIYGVELDIQATVHILSEALQRLMSALVWLTHLPPKQRFLAVGSIFWHYRQVFDLLLKLLRRACRFKGITARSPRDLLVEANLRNWLTAEDQWLSYLGLRVRLDEILYEEEATILMAEALQNFPEEATALINNLKSQEPDLAPWLA